MMVGIIANLRRGFEYVGGEGVYNPTTLQGDPSGERVEGKELCLPLALLLLQT